MGPSFVEDGFEIHRSVLDSACIEVLRTEADAIAAATGSACVRHLRRRSPVFDELSRSEVVQSLLPEVMRPVRSLLFDKTPEENWPVLWHQDLTIAVKKQRDVPGYGPWSLKEETWHVQPPCELLSRMVTIRLHLDETGARNGALRVLPGSHRNGRIESNQLAALGKSNAVTCECGVSDALLMSPLLLHSSPRSATPSRRRVIHFEYAPEGILDPALSWLESV